MLYELQEPPLHGGSAAAAAVSTDEAPSKCLDGFLLCGKEVEEGAVAKRVKRWGTEVVSNVLLNTSKGRKISRERNSPQKL